MGEEEVQLGPRVGRTDADSCTRVEFTGLMRTDEGMRIVVANEPAAYREVLAASFQLLRPDVEVITLEPHDLDREIERLDPHLVVCSRLTEAVKSRPLAWVLLYPDGTSNSRSLICIAGECVEVDSIKLGDLLATIDQVRLLPQLRLGADDLSDTQAIPP